MTLQAVFTSSAISDTDKSEDTLTSNPDSEDFVQEELIRLRSENSVLRERVQDLHEDLAYSRNALHNCYQTLEEISSLRKPFCQPPPEILLMIFERTIPPSFILDPLASLSPNSMWCRVFQQKKAIVNVCRTWHKIGLPFLYEDICIQHISQLLQLLRTLESPEDSFKHFVKVVSFQCLVPAWFGRQFEHRLKSLFILCPQVASFSYLSSCQLPSPTSLSVLPFNLTHLQIVEGISAELLNNVLILISLNIVSLSIHIPLEDFVFKSTSGFLYFRQLEELSLGVTSTTILKLNHFCHRWGLALVTRLTFRMHGSWERIVSIDAFNMFCRGHMGLNLEYLHIYPEYGWSMPHFTLPMQDLLDSCPKLRHIVIHPRTIVPLTHKRVEWVDIWTSHAVSSCGVYWQSIRNSITPSAFPSLQGVRLLSSSVSYSPNLPLILPPGQVSTPSESFGYSFLDLDVRHDVGEIRRVLPVENDSSDEEDSDFQSISSDSEYCSEGSDSLDWEIHSEAEHSVDWDAEMDALE